ncbi:hypothetical protein [Thalassotalea marina]|uniref:ABC transporter permease n=1 Tax=Thalassotalea marina TaxID=1673741 RepID=A0A919EHM0_9GAMM|nr:hypothetical protein [Thalassotalea marina]GHF84307.1 hypothetical protein GCM10017161_09630 [Thalassotalea marina]
MFNTAIIRSVYGKEFREFSQDTRTLMIVFLVPLLLIPIITLATYSTNIEVSENQQRRGVIANDCQQIPTEILATTRCVTPSEKASVMQQVKTSELNSLLDLTTKELYLANAALTSEQYLKNIERDFLSLQYSDSTYYQVIDLKSEESIVNVIGTSLANVLVMLIITFSFVGAVNFGIDTTTGEKERGSFGLYAEFKENLTSIFAGKLAFTSFCSALSALLGIVGITLSIVAVEHFYGDTASLTQSESEKVTAFFNYVQMLSLQDVLVVLLYLIPCVVLISSLVNLFGCIAKNMKEAKMLSLVLIILIVTLTKVDLGDGNFFYTAFIPVLNVFTGVNNALTQSVDYSHLVVSILVNISICINNLFDIKKLIIKEKI